MKKMHLFRSSRLPLVLLAFAINPSLCAQNGLLREVWRNVERTRSIDALLQHPDFPDRPASRSILQDFNAPENFADRYGQR